MQIANRNTADGYVIFLVGMTTQAIWMFFVPFWWGWDAASNLAIGRMYFQLPYEMWNIKFYYPPAYPIFLTLMGIHHLDTLMLLRIATLFVGGLMPLLLHLMLRPFNRPAAFFAPLAFALTFVNALFSTDLMNHHFHAFQLLLMSVFVAIHLARPRLSTGVLIGLAAALAQAGRQVTAFIFVAAVVLLSLAEWIESRRGLEVAKNALVVVLTFAAALGTLSVARYLALGGPYQFGLTYDNGARVMFIGNYYGGSLYQKEFHPNESAALVRPENGPASKELFALMRSHFDHVDVKQAGLADTDDKDQALRGLIEEPNNAKPYAIWWTIDGALGPKGGDRLLSKVITEMIVAQPQIARYYAWNFWQSLFGPPMLPALGCIKCVCPPCFFPVLPQANNEPFKGASIFSKVAGPGVIAEMQVEHARTTAVRPHSGFIFRNIHRFFAWKPFLTALLLVSVFLTRGKTRLLMMYCVAVVVLVGGTTALAWPVQARYQYPTLPYILAGATVAVYEMISRVRDFVRARAAPRVPAG